MPQLGPRSFVAYVRVSTGKQGQSGLGLEAQEAAIRAFLHADDRLVLPLYVEVESSKRVARPELAKAMAKCRATGATLLIAKLDRLARNVAFIANLMESRVPFVCADRPNAIPSELHIYALMAEEETRAISARTKAALAAAKARGTTLGGRRERGHVFTAEDQQRGAQISGEVQRIAADHAAHRAAPRILALRAKGLSLRAVASTLNAEGVQTPRSGAWTAMAVKRALARVSEAA